MTLSMIFQGRFQEIHKDIKEYNEDSWKEKYKNYHDKFNGIDDGHASQKVIDVIKKVSR